MLVCQITSKAVSDHYGVPISSDDFTTGKLRHDSNIRPNRLFTADSSIVLYRAGKLRTEKVLEVIAKIVDLLKA